MRPKAKLKPRGPNRNKPSVLRKITAQFRDMLKDGGLTPSTYLLGRLRDEKLAKGIRDKIALGLVCYELPRLASIEADVTTTQKSHEEWLDELEDRPAANGHDREEGTMLQ